MNQRQKTVQMQVAAEDRAAFSVLLAEGFAKDAEVGVCLHDLLVRQMGIDPTYLNDRVQTIFLNGRAVDDIFQEMVFDGDVIALSAAMPGLAGAVFRRAGILSSMRSLSAPARPPKTTAMRFGRIVLKLFNLIARELGPDFLEAGVCVDQKRLLSLLKRNVAEFKKICRRLIIDGEECSLNSALSTLDENGEAFFSVRRE